MPVYVLFDMLGMDLISFRKCPPEIFPRTSPIFLENTYINYELLASGLLYGQGASKAGQE